MGKPLVGELDLTSTLDQQLQIASIFDRETTMAKDEHPTSPTLDIPSRKSIDDPGAHDLGNDLHSL